MEFKLSPKNKKKNNFNSFPYGTSKFKIIKIRKPTINHLCRLKTRSIKHFQFKNLKEVFDFKIFRSSSNING